MPSISAVGNISPVSTTTMRPSYSTTVMFLPISPSPPEGKDSQGAAQPAAARSGPLERRADRRPLPLVGGDHRQPQASDSITPSISRAALTGIGLAVTVLAS